MDDTVPVRGRDRSKEDLHRRYTKGPEESRRRRRLVTTLGITGPSGPRTMNRVEGQVGMTTSVETTLQEVPGVRNKVLVGRRRVPRFDGFPGGTEEKKTY